MQRTFNTHFSPRTDLRAVKSAVGILLLHHTPELMRTLLKKELNNGGRPMIELKVMAGKLFLVLVFSSIALCVQAQFTLEGRVTDDGEGLPGASVLLLSPDSTFLTGIATDTTGKFNFRNIASGNYLVAISMIGYASYGSQPVRVRDSNYVLPEIMLKPNAVQLNEIMVKAERDLLENSPGKLVINLENSVTSSGNTILEVLQKSPGVIVNRQDNTIRINGRSGVTVMINGKPVPMSPEALLQMLDGMNASGIRNIEVITSPGASYDADGSGGVINLVMKDNDDIGTSVGFGLTAGASWAETLAGNLSLVHRVANFRAFADYSATRRHNLHIAELKEHSKEHGFDRVVSAYSHRENITLQQNLRAGLEWDLNKTKLDVDVTAYSRNWNLRARTDEVANLAVDSTTTTDMRIVEKNLWQSVTVSAGVERTIREKGTLNLSFNYLYYRNNNPSDYKVDSFYEQANSGETSEIDLKKTTPIHFLVSRIDYSHRASTSLNLEAGVKSVFATLDNNVTVQRRVDETWTTDPAFTSSSTLNERIYAAYVSAQWRPSPQVDIHSGVRYEFTSTDISSPLQRDIVTRKYGYLFPNLSVRKNLALEKDVHLSYARRIVRPGYNDIAPFVFFWGVGSFSAGNTKLYPAIVDAISAGYHLKQWNISLNLAYAQNEIASLQPERDSLSNLIYRSQNLKSLKTFGITNTYSATICSWWTLQANLTTQYQVATSSHLPVNFKKKLPGLNVTLINRFKLPKDISIEVGVLYQSRLISGISQYLPMGSLNAGIQKSFGKQGTLQLAMDDILYTNYWNIETDSPGNDLTSSFRYDWHNQYIRLSYTRNLGKRMTRGIERESRAEEERGRVR